MSEVQRLSSFAVSLMMYVPLSLAKGGWGPLHSCGSSNNSLKAMKTMTPMIAAKNMAGKETADSSMLSPCPHPAPLHNAIVCANRWFCWQACGHSHFVRDCLKPRHVRGFLLLPPPALGRTLPSRHRASWLPRPHRHAPGVHRRSFQAKSVLHAIE